LPNSPNSRTLTPSAQSLAAIPQFETRRRPDRPTLGPAVEAVAQKFGYSLKPFQRRFADVALELVPDEETGAMVFAYDRVCLSVGRRAGKTFLVLMMMVRAMLAERRVGVRFTAQNRASAVLHLRESFVPMIDDSRLSGLFSQRLANGSEALTIPGNGSFMRLFSPLPSSLHGSEADLVVVDECFSFSSERGADLETAIAPTLLTTGGQLFLTSAAGDLSSTWWAGLLDSGRAATRADTGRGLCHMEWTADVDELDPDNPETWLKAHPGGLKMAALQSAYDANREQFYRTILNITNRTGATGSPIDLPMFRRSMIDHEPDQTATLTLGVDCSPDQATTALVACIGGDIVEVIDHRPGGPDWVPGLIARIVDTRDCPTVALDYGGPAGVLVAPLQALGVPLKALGSREVAAAAASLAAGISTGGLRFRPDVSMSAAVEGARRRTYGDGGWAYARRASKADTSPLIAASLAVSVHPDAYLSNGPTVN
jgi:hypothetical protein